MGPGSIDVAVFFNGTSARYTRGEDLLHNADGKRGTVLARVRIDGGAGVSRVLLRNTDGRFQVTLGGSDKWSVQGRNSADVLKLNLASATAYLPSTTTGHTLLVSWDLGAAAAQLYVDDVADLAGGALLANDSIDYTRPGWTVGATEVPGGFWNGVIDTLFFHEDYVDLSVAANRRLFTEAAGYAAVAGFPVGLGAEGRGPFGAQPILLLNSAGPGAFGRNAGFGGDFIQVGGPSYVSGIQPSPTQQDSMATRRDDDFWRRCDRCGFAFPERLLRRERATGSIVCKTTERPGCWSTDRDEILRWRRRVHRPTAVRKSFY